MPGEHSGLRGGLKPGLKAQRGVYWENPGGGAPSDRSALMRVEQALGVASASIS
jgi:hypothetical protein